MNKRAEWTFLNTMTIIAGIIVAIILGVIVTKIASKDAAQSGFYAKDSALLADAILAAPQEVQLYYPAGFSTRYIRLENGSFSVFSVEPEEGKDSPYKYFFSTRGDIEAINNQIVMSSLFFLKNSSTFTIGAMPMTAAGSLIAYDSASNANNHSGQPEDTPNNP